MDEGFSNKILILGGGEDLHLVARQAASAGLSPVLARLVGEDGHRQGVEEGRDTTFEQFWFSHIERVEGEAGSFQVALALPDGNEISVQVGAIVVALEPGNISPKALWHLEGPVYSASEAIGLEPKKFESAKCVVFLSGFKHTSYPFTQRRALELALSVRKKRDIEIFFLLEHFKAADVGMEKLFREVRDSGVIFVKLSSGSPEIETHGEGFRVSFADEYLGQEVVVDAQALVFEDIVEAPPAWAEIATTLGIHTDSRGFFQSDNVRNFPIYTNRRGIYVVGSAKGPVSNMQFERETQAAFSDILNLLGVERAPSVSVDLDNCAVCLTCYRTCPHAAVYFELGIRGPQFLPAACMACGMCVSACPGQALSLPGPNGNALSAQKMATVIFACQNSAYEAYRLAEKMGMGEVEAQVVKVNCGGSVKLEAMLEALEKGAETVMVLVCHHDSCASLSGSLLAEGRVKLANTMLEEVGVGQKKILFASLSPACADKFIRIAKGSF